jgi:hypothetical protein
MAKTPKVVADLTPAEYNPRGMTDEQHQARAKSMQEFGDLSGIVFNRRTGSLVGAHQRREHLPADLPIVLHERRRSTPNKQGTIATGYVDLDGERWQYREVDVDVEREKAMNVAANKHSGFWNYDELARVLEDFETIEAELVGFSEVELQSIIRNSLPDDDGDDIPDEFPEVDPTTEHECPKCGYEF